MRALTWHAHKDVRVEDVPEPELLEPTDAIVKVSSTAICGSDLHLYGVLGPFLDSGDILGHEFMGTVETVGSAVENLEAGDRVVVPFNIACGSCWMCERGLHAQCETTQVREYDSGAAMFGYTRLYGSVPGGQAEYVRVPHADFGAVKLPQERSDERFLYLSDILPTAWQGVEYADVPPGGSLAVFGLGPVGQMAVRCARLQGIDNVIGIDRVPERLALAAEHGAQVINLEEVQEPGTTVLEMTDGRGADGCLDAVGMEAHGNPVAAGVISAVGKLPDPFARAAMSRAGLDRLAALRSCIAGVRRGGTVSVSGVYGGNADPLPMLTMFDKGIQVRMGQCHVRRWTDELLGLLDQDVDVLGVDGFATHHLPLEEAPSAYAMFREKSGGCVKVVLHPHP